MPKTSNQKSHSNCNTNTKKIDYGERGYYHLNNKLNELTGKEWVKFTKSWNIINPSPRKDDTILHPAKFPEELVKEFISFFTKSGQIVLDPFLGTGSTLVSANELDRYGVGIELNEKYAEISKTRVSDKLDKNQFVITGDASKIDTELEPEMANVLGKLGSNNVDYIITSPPYWDILKNSRGNIKSMKKTHVENGGDVHYSDKNEDLGNMKDYEEYMEVLVHILKKLKNYLKSGGYLTIVIQNVRVKKGNMVPVAWDLGLRLSNIYELKQEKLWLQNNKRLFCWGYPSTYVSNVHHHYCLIFQKS